MTKETKKELKMSNTRPNKFYCKAEGCGGKYSYTLKTIAMETGIRRVRQCTKCGALYETFERKTGMTKASDELQTGPEKDGEDASGTQE